MFTVKSLAVNVMWKARPLTRVHPPLTKAAVLVLERAKVSVDNYRFMFLWCFRDLLLKDK